MPQTTIISDPVYGLPGLLYDSGFKDSITRSLETAAGSEAGRILVWGATPMDTVKTPAAAGAADNLAGVTIRRDVKEPQVPMFSQYEDVTLLRKGRIWVTAGTGGLAVGGTTLFLYHATAEAGLLSSVTDDANTVAVSLLQFVVLKAAAAGALALIGINLP